MMDPRTLPDDILALLDDENDHEVSTENLEWVGEAFKQVLRSRLSKREKSPGALRFSSLGKKDRQLWYQENMPEKAEKMPPKTLFKFLYGDVIELLLLFLAKEAGHEVTHLQHEVEVDGVLGHTDAVIDGVPVDVKSASTYSFQKFKSGEIRFQDPFGYIKQLSGYANALQLTDRAGFLVADKVHGDIHFAEIDEETILGNKPEPRIEHLREVLSKDEPPPRCYPEEPDGKSGNMKLSVGCSYCPFKGECHKDANGGRGLRTFIYSTGPRFLTKVERVPDVFEVEDG